MNDLQLLFVVLGVLYLWECVGWLGTGSIACLTWLGKNWCIKPPAQFFGNQQGGFVFAAPFPPLGSIVVGNISLFSMSPQGIFTNAVDPAGLIRFDSIKTVETNGRKVVINGKAALKYSSPTLAQFVTHRIREIKAEAPDRRGAAIEQIVQSMFDTKEIEKRWAEFKQRNALIRGLANGLLLVVFGLAPVMIGKFGLRATWLSLVVEIFAFTLMLAFLFFRAHKHFFPAAEDDRFTHTLVVLLAPVSAMRAHDLLSRRLLEMYHPLAIAQVLCPEEAVRAYAEKTLRELRYSIPPEYPGSDNALKETDAFSRETQLRVMEHFLKRNELNPDDLCRAPKPSDDTCLSYCPRCLAQFTTVEGQCADCGGVPLVAFTAASPASKDPVGPGSRRRRSAPSRPKK